MPILFDHKDVRDFISYLYLKNLSQRTITNYQTELNNFFRFCPQEVENPLEVTFEHLRDYIAGLQARGLAAKTICGESRLINAINATNAISTLSPLHKDKKSI